MLAGHTLSEQGECQHSSGSVCPFQQLNTLAVPKYVGLFADLALFAFGLFLFVKKQPEEKAQAKAKQAMNRLQGDEAKIADLLMQGNGMSYQHELVEKTGFSKVKITRLLDKLEAQGLIERRRRGMTNLVVMK